jgi:hypothetical protein
MNLIIEGTVVSGVGGAAATLAVQLPLFLKERPELAVCKAGTINILLDEPLRINKPDFSIGPIRYEIGWVESYGFQRIMLEVPIGAPARPAWIYMPDKSPHRHNLFGVEVIGPHFDGVVRDARCRMTIAREFKTVSIHVIA